MKLKILARTPGIMKLLRSMKRFCTAFQPVKVSVAALFCTEKAPSGTLFPKSAVSALQKRFEQRLKRQF